ncbi:FAD-binding domain-containing protein [Lipomyces japonicus]|uniref:FAD-binding domain-containing protein n=1 Tax=Lipomyces japonicus TaxID=56871 RepID=UPI0034CFDE74
MFDRLVRLIRIYGNGGLIHAKFQIQGDSLIRVTIPNKNLMQYNPGSYVFLYVMTPLGFWQSHPFSPFISRQSGEEGSLTLLSKRQGGITKNLFNQLTASNGQAQHKVLVEGFYGHTPPLRVFHTIVILSSGSGITAVYSVADSLRNLASRGTHVVFRWIVQNESALDWANAELESLVGVVDLNIYITQGINERESATEKNATSSLPVLPITYSHDRPNVTAWVDGLVDEAKGSVAFMS